MAMYCFKKNSLILYLFFLSVLVFGAEKDPFSLYLTKKMKYFEGKENKKVVRLFLKKWNTDSFSIKDKELMTYFVSDFENRAFNQDYYINFFSFCNYLSQNNSEKLSYWLNVSHPFLVHLNDNDLDFFLTTNNQIIKEGILFKKMILLGLFQVSALCVSGTIVHITH